MRSRLLVGVTSLVALIVPSAAALADAPKAATAETVAWFQATEQALMDALAVGDKGTWERILDPSGVITSEEGERIPAADFLRDFRGLPPPLTGGITVKELTVDEYAGFAVVRFLADEWEVVFGQRLAPQYRVTNTYRRAGDEWKLVASHLSVVTEDPPAQDVSTAGWPGLVGAYRLEPDGWTFTVELREGKLYGGRDPAKLGLLVPVAPDAFVASGSLGEWIFVADAGGKVNRLVNLRKFQTLVWTRVEPK